MPRINWPMLTAGGLLSLALFMSIGRAAPPATQPTTKPAPRPAKKPADVAPTPLVSRFAVSAGGGWQKVVDLKAGQEVSITASGTWSVAKESWGPEGKGNDNYLEGRFGEDKDEVNNPLLRVGKKFAFIAPADATFYLHLRGERGLAAGKKVTFGQISVVMSILTPAPNQQTTPADGRANIDAVLKTIADGIVPDKGIDWTPLKASAANDTLDTIARNMPFAFTAPLGKTHKAYGKWEMESTQYSTGGLEVLIKAYIHVAAEKRLATIDSKDVIAVRGRVAERSRVHNDLGRWVIEIHVENCSFNKVDP